MKLIDCKVEPDKERFKLIYDNGQLCYHYYDGTKRWYLNGKYHREDSPAVEYADGSKYWHLNGKLHREDGPAIEYADGTKQWYLNGKRHCEDGPACEWSNGTKYWFLNGKHLAYSEWKQEVAKLNKVNHETH